MPRILVADPLAEDGLERLRRAGEVTVVSKVGEAELIERPHTLGFQFGHGLEVRERVGCAAQPVQQPRTGVVRRGKIGVKAQRRR